MLLTMPSVGHLIVDSLSTRLGLKLVEDSQLDGFYARDTVQLYNHYVELALLKTSQSAMIQA